MNDIKIHDIKPLVSVPDFSLYLAIGLLVIGILVVAILVYLIYKSLKNKKADNYKKYYQILKELDLNNPKQSAYLITKYGRILAKSDTDKKILHDLIIQLNNHKYKKNIEPFCVNTKAQFQLFMENLDV